MALSSKCIKCDSTSFEMVEHEPRKSRVKVMFIQFSRCGGVVGAMDFHSIGTMLKQQNEALRKIARAANVTVNLD